MQKSHLTLALSIAASLTLGSCQQKSPKALATQPVQQSRTLTPREANPELANGKVNEMDFHSFVTLIVEDNPNELIFNCPTPSIIDFSATWCGPCKQLEPIYKELAEKYKDKVAFYHVDIDKQPDLAQSLGIESVPTLLFANKQYSSHTVGLMDKASLEEAVENLLRQ